LFFKDDYPVLGVDNVPSVGMRGRERLNDLNVAPARFTTKKINQPRELVFLLCNGFAICIGSIVTMPAQFPVVVWFGVHIRVIGESELPFIDKFFNLQRRR
jgi:hypothetical protein